MKKLLIGTSSVLVLGIVGLIALPSLVPSERYKEKIEAQLTKELGRNVSVLGDVKLGVFPVIRANTGRVEIENPEGYSDAHFASMDAMSVRVKLLPLLSKRVEITSFTLKNPLINLERRADGQENWVFGDPEDAAPKNEPESGPFKRDGRYADIDPAIGKFTLEGGKISYVDAVKGASHKVEGVNVAVSLTGLAAPLKIDGDLIYNGTAADVDIDLNSPRDFLDGSEAPLNMKLKTDFTQIEAKGRFLAGEDIAFNFDVDGDVSDMKRLLSLSPKPVPHADKISTVKLAGNYNFDGKTLSAKGADISAKGPTFDAGFKGDATLTEKPILNGQLTLDARDVKSLARSLDKEIKGLDLIQTAKVTADFKAQGAGFSANNIVANIGGDGLQASFNGAATSGDQITAKGTFAGSADSVAALLSALEIDAPQAAAVKAAKLKGNIAYTEDNIALSGLDVTTSGGAVNGRYQGGANLRGKDINAEGLFSLDIPSVGNASQLAGLELEAAKAIGNLAGSGAVKVKGKNYALSNLDFKTSGGALAGSYKGAANMQGKALNANGQFSLDIPNVANASQIAGLDVAAANALGALSGSGTVKVEGKNYALSNLDFNTSGGALAGSYKGAAAKQGENLTANGQFDVNIPNVAEANRLAALNIDAANAVGSLTANGGINLAGKDIALSNLSAQTKGEIINASYNGALSLGEGAQSYRGNFNSTLSSLDKFSKLTGIDVPYKEALGTITASGNVSGEGKAVSISGLTAKLAGGQITGQYTGSARLDNGFNLDGQLDAEIPSLRAVAATAGNNSLPPSTATGQIYERFALSGRVNGSPANIKFQNAAIALDAIKGTGSFDVDLTREKPNITSALTLDGLDLRPYMAAYTAQKPTGKIEPWSEEPINTAGLKAVNGSFTLDTPNIITDRMSLGQSNISATLNNGVLKADIPNLLLYSGLGRLNTTFDASSTIPSFTLDAGLDKLNTNSFLSAIAGFTNATGESGTSFSLSGSGRSQAEIMRSLSGNGEFKVQNGEIQGVDMTTLLTGLDSAFTSRSLPGGIGSNYATKFNDILGQVKIANGVASIDDFSFSGLGVLAEGGGSIDIGRQKIDFSLRPRLTGSSANNLASFGIPIKVQGGFGATSIGLDTDFLGQIVAQQAQAKAASLIQEQVGGQLGGALGSVIGSGSGGQNASGDIIGSIIGSQSAGGQSSAGNVLGSIIGGQQRQTTTQQAPTQQQRQSSQDAVSGLLGGILGGSSAPQSQPGAPAPQQQQKEPDVEDLIGGLFGKKKKR